MHLLTLIYRSRRGFRLFQLWGGTESDCVQAMLRAGGTGYEIKGYIEHRIPCTAMARSYQPESTRSRPISEVNLVWARLVLC